MRADFHVLLDACVMANQGVCDLLLSLAERPRLFVPHWSAQIMAPNHAKVKPGIYRWRGAGARLCSPSHHRGRQL